MIQVVYIQLSGQNEKTYSYKLMHRNCLVLLCCHKKCVILISSFRWQYVLWLQVQLCPQRCSSAKKTTSNNNKIFRFPPENSSVFNLLWIASSYLRFDDNM